MTTFKTFHPCIRTTFAVALWCMAAITVYGQREPIRVPQLEFRNAVNSIANLRVGEQSEDGTEVTLIMEYSYNGRSGSSAMLMPIIENKDHPESGRWFGADMVKVPPGRGPVSIKMRFFNDESDVPAVATTDRVRILILNGSGTSVIGGTTLLKTVQWGKEGASVVKSTLPANSHAEDLARLASETVARARQEAKAAAAAELAARQSIEDQSLAGASREELVRQAQLQGKARQEAEERAALAAELITERKRDVTGPPPTTALKTRITNIEVVNRSRDRRQITLGIELEPDDQFEFDPLLDVAIRQGGDPDALPGFETVAAPLERRTKAVLIPVKLVGEPTAPALLTDKIEVFITDKTGTKHLPVLVAPLVMTWRSGSNEPAAPAPKATIALEDFRQRNPTNGYALVKYNLSTGDAALRVRMFNAANPRSVAWFETQPVPVRPGRGLELLPVSLSDSTEVPAGVIKADTIEAELVNGQGQVIARATRRTDVDWSSAR